MRIAWLVLGCVLAVGCKGKAQPAGGGAKPIAVKASELVADYQKNEVAADEKYKGKRVRIAAIVESIDKDAFDSIVLALKAEGSLLGVHAEMKPSEKTAVAKLEKSQAVLVECTGRGMILRTPMLGDCVVLKEGKVLR